MSGRTVCVCVYVYSEKKSAETSTMNDGMVLTRYGWCKHEYMYYATNRSRETDCRGEAGKCERQGNGDEDEICI